MTNNEEAVISIPEDVIIEKYIRKGISLGRIKEKKKKRSFHLSAAAVLFAVIFAAGIRYSPVLAYYAGKIPGLDYIVKLINYDKGVEDAVKNNFVQEVNISQEHEGLIITLKDIIIDKSRAIIFYSIENKGNHKIISIDKAEFKDSKGEVIKAGVNYDMPSVDFEKQKKLEGSFELSFFAETEIPDAILLNITLKEADSDSETVNTQKILQSAWGFKIPVDKKKFESFEKVYTINQGFEIEGQKIYFKTMTIMPTRILLDVEYDPSNTKKILFFDDLQIIDEKGEKRGTIANGILSTSQDEYHQTWYFQSNYFTDAKELYITGGSIRVVDKDKDKVLVDIENKQLLKAPDSHLSLVSVEKGNNNTKLCFNLKRDMSMDENKTYSIFAGTVKDAKGTVYNISSTGAQHDKSGIDNIEINISSGILSSPVELPIVNYPSRLKGEFKIRVK